MRHFKFYLPFFLLLFWIQINYSQNQPFIMLWQTDAEIDEWALEGFASEDNQVRLVAFGNYQYEWVERDDEGNILDNFGNGMATDTHTFTFPHAGIYEISITPAGDTPFHQIKSEYIMGDAHKLLEVKQWGDVVWSSFEKAFQGCTRMEITAEDLPNLSQVTNMNYIFAETSFETISQLENWEISNVTHISNSFHNNQNFNQDISSWNVSNIQDMSYMFYSTKEFDQDITNWDVSNVINMSGLFAHTEAFDQPIGSWDVSSVENMASMFRGAVFNQPIGNWDVSNVTNMSSMFSSNSVFDQDISEWNVSNVTDMSGMFASNSVFNRDIGNWDVSNVTDMSAMFLQNTAFNQDIESWDVGNVIDMTSMFSSNQTFEQPIGQWDVSNVQDMAHMFIYSNYNQDISNWDVGNVIDMSWMFAYTTHFNQDIGNWDVGNVEEMYKMFENAQVFNQDLSGWDVGQVNTFMNIFKDAVRFDQDLSNWNLGSLKRWGENINDFSFAGSGMSCQNYSKTIKGWQENPLTPIFRILDATGMEYSPEVAENHEGLIDHQWTIIGDEQGNCELSFESFMTKDFKLYPNPVEDILTIESPVLLETVEVYNPIGQRLKSITTKSEKAILDLGGWSKGIYFIKINIQDQSETFKVIKK